MKTLLIYHQGDNVSGVALARWLASFTELVGLVVLNETGGRMWRRIRREVQRVGAPRFLDVLAFRAYYRVFLRNRDRRWERARLEEVCKRYPAIPDDTPCLCTHSPNTPEAEGFIRRCAPDLMIARCKTLLKEKVFSLPSRGTFVMHPGICPEYRNAHGCFWALARDDREKVGMTLLRINRGVDTGPVYGYYGCALDEVADSHIVIQHKVVLDNLERLESRLHEIYKGDAMPLDTTDRPSGEWGQPWLTAYLRWKWRARRRK